MSITVTYWSTSANEAIRLRNNNKGFTHRVDAEPEGSLPTNPQGRVRWNSGGNNPTGNGKLYSLLVPDEEKQWNRKMRVDMGESYNGVTLSNGGRPYTWQVSYSSPISWSFSLIQIVQPQDVTVKNDFKAQMIRSSDDEDKLSSDFYTVDGNVGFYIRLQISDDEWDRNAQVLVRWSDAKEKLKNDVNCGKWYSIFEPEEECDWNAVVRVPFQDYYQTTNNFKEAVFLQHNGENKHEYYFQIRANLDDDWDIDLDNDEPCKSVNRPKDFDDSDGDKGGELFPEGAILELPNQKSKNTNTQKSNEPGNQSGNPENCCTIL
jgi:hypothetical protein